MAGATERVVLASPIAAAGGRVIASPFQFYCDGADHLRIEGWNSLTGAAVTVAGRWFNPAGEIDTFAHALALTADRARTRRDVALTKGYLVNLVVYVSTGAPRLGQTFVKIGLIRGLTGATILLGVLLQGYVTAEQGLAWPGSPITDSLSQLAPRLILGTAPAAGAELSETVPTGARWELLSFNSLLTTDATVINRRPSIVIDDGAGNPIWRSSQPQTIAASLSKTCYWMSGMPHDMAITADALTAGIPTGTELLAGHRVRTATEAFKLGDQYGAPYLIVREKLEVTG